LGLVYQNDKAIHQREQEISDVAKSIHELAEIFRDLQTLVIDQGTLLDRIDYNIEQVSVSMKTAHQELVKVSNVYLPAIYAPLSIGRKVPEKGAVKVLSYSAGSFDRHSLDCSAFKS